MLGSSTRRVRLEGLTVDFSSRSTTTGLGPAILKTDLKRFQIYSSFRCLLMLRNGQQHTINNETFKKSLLNLKN